MSLILIDGSALFYRSHYAFARRPLTAPNGEVTSVVFGFFSSLLGLIEKHQPEKMAVVFDVKGKNFRHEMYPEYKAQRKPMPEELAEQLPRLRELLEAWGIAVLEKKGGSIREMLLFFKELSKEKGDAIRHTQLWLRGPSNPHT